MFEHEDRYVDILIFKVLSKDLEHWRGGYLVRMVPVVLTVRLALRKNHVQLPPQETSTVVEGRFVVLFRLATTARLELRRRLRQVAGLLGVRSRGGANLLPPLYNPTKPPFSLLTFHLLSQLRVPTCKPSFPHSHALLSACLKSLMTSIVPSCRLQGTCIDVICSLPVNSIEPSSKKC